MCDGINRTGQGNKAFVSSGKEQRSSRRDRMRSLHGQKSFVRCHVSLVLLFKNVTKASIKLANQTLIQSQLRIERESLPLGPLSTL